jgi:hypothetical protein
VIEKRGKIKHINQYNENYDPLHYVLPFIYGEQGYHYNIQQDIIQKNDQVNTFYKCSQINGYNFKIILETKNSIMYAILLLYIADKRS